MGQTTGLPFPLVAVPELGSPGAGLLPPVEAPRVPPLAELTARVAGLLVAVQTPRLVKTARYWYPLMETVVLASVRVVEVAPARSLKPPPSLVETCHCTVGVGLPVAAEVKEAVAPAITD